MEGTVGKETDSYLVTLKLYDRRHVPLGEREVKVGPRNCKEVVEPSALLLAMMIVVARSQARDAPSDSPSPDGMSSAPAIEPPEAPHSIERRSETAPPSTAQPNPPLRASVATGATASVGALPNPGVGAFAHVTFTRTRLYGGLGFAYEHGGSVTAPGGTIEFQHVSAAVRVGLLVGHWGRATLGVHLGVRGGLLHTSPRGDFLVRTDTMPTFVAGGGVLRRVPLTRRVHLEAWPELHAAVRRNELEVLDQGRPLLIHQTPRLEGRLSVGISFELP